MTPQWAQMAPCTILMTPARDPKQNLFEKHLEAIWESLRLRSHLGGLWMSWETSRGHLGSGNHLGGIWETSGKHLGGIWEASQWHLSIWDLGSIWEASGKHQGSIWEASGKHLGGIWASGIWEASGRHLGGISGHLGSGRHLGSIWEASGKHLGSIWEASTLGFPPLSRRCLLGAQGLLTNTVGNPPD